MSHTTFEKSSVFLSPSGFKVVRPVPSSASLIMVILPSTCNEIILNSCLIDCIESLECQGLFYEGPTEWQTICTRKFPGGWFLLWSQIQFYNAQHAGGSPVIDSFHSGSIALLNSCTSPIVGMSKSYSNDCSRFVAQLQLPFVQETSETLTSKLLAWVRK